MSLCSLLKAFTPPPPPPYLCSSGLSLILGLGEDAGPKICELNWLFNQYISQFYVYLRENFFFTASDDNSDNPNKNLFTLLLENMERLNDRDVELTDEDGQRFTQHIQSRPRNGVPLPFPEELCQAKESSRSTLNNGREKRSRNGNTTLIKWRCFIRSVNDHRGYDRLILTFLPASFEHIRLMGKYVRGRSPSTGSSARGPHYVAEMEPEGASNENSSLGGSEQQKQKFDVSLLSQGSVEGVFWTMYELS